MEVYLSKFIKGFARYTSISLYMGFMMFLPVLMSISIIYLARIMFLQN